MYINYADNNSTYEKMNTAAKLLDTLYDILLGSKFQMPKYPEIFPANIGQNVFLGMFGC